MSDESSFDIDKLARRSATTRHPRETEREYIDRLAEAHGFPSDEREEFKELVTKALYGQNGLTEEEETRLEKYVSLVEPSAEDKSESAKSANTPTQRSQQRQDESKGVEETKSPKGTDTTERAGTTKRTQELVDRRLSTPGGLKTIISSRDSVASVPRVGKSKYARRLFTYVYRLDSADIFYFSFLIAASIFIFFYNLDHFAIRNWDEGVHANLARHMVQDGYWLVPHMNYNLNGFEPWLMKPPLVVWLQGITMELLGVNEFAVRFQSALFGVCTVGLVYVFGRRMESQFAGFVSGVVFLTTPYLVFGSNAVRTGAMDSAHVFLGSLFVFCVWKAVTAREDRWFYYAGIAGGLTVMVKGFGAGIFVLIVLPLVVRYWKLFASRAALKGASLTLLIILPWSIYMYFRFGYSFIETILVEEVLLRAAGERVASSGGMFEFMDYPYFTELWENWSFYHPWIFVILGVIPGSLPFLLKRKKRDSLFVVWWMAVVLGFFAYTGTQKWYIMPMYVPGALLLGLSTSQAVKDPRALSGILLGIILALVYSPRFEFANERGYVLILLAICLCAVVVLRSRLSSLSSSRILRHGRTVVPLVLAVLVVSTFLGAPPFYQSGADFVFEQKEMGEWVNEEVPADETIYIEDGLGSMHTFSFYAERPMAAVDPESLPDEATYAFVDTNSLDGIDREYAVEYNMSEYNRTLIRVE